MANNSGDIISAGVENYGIIKPDFVTIELLSKYANNKCKLFGFVGNFEDNNTTAIPTSVLREMNEQMGIDYLLTHFSRSSYDAYFRTLENASDGTQMKIINRWDVFRGPNNDWLDDELLLNAVQMDSFYGVLIYDEPAVKNPQSGSYSDMHEFEWMVTAYGKYKNFENNRFNIFVESIANNNYGHFGERVLTEELPSGVTQNQWMNGQPWEGYVDDLLEYSDSISSDFYVLQYNEELSGQTFVDKAVWGPVDWHPLIIRSRKKRWAKYMAKLLKEHNKAPEKPYKQYVSTSEEIKGGSLVTDIMTPESLSLQAYSVLIGGSNNIGLFLVNDIDGQFIYSPYTHNFESGATFEVLNNFVNGKFKHIKDFIASKYIYDVDFIVNQKPLLHNLDEYYNKFILNVNNDAFISISFDYRCCYCFVVNTSLSESLFVKTANRVNQLSFDSSGKTTETPIEQTTVIPGELLILKKKYSRKQPEFIVGRRIVDGGAY